MKLQTKITTVQVRYEHDLVATRQRARQIASLLGFEHHDQTRIATAVSEIARNAFKYAGGGRVEFLVEGRPPSTFGITVQDDGPGIKQLKDVLDGTYQSRTGMGLGIVGAKRLMDDFEITTELGRGTTVRMLKEIPPRNRRVDLAIIAEELAKRVPGDPVQELQQQNQELMRTLEELAQVNRELEETNRGVVALYAELDDKADFLQRASELKSRFLSNMTHEFRTPLNSILSLSRLLLDKREIELPPEQEKQVTYVRRAAEDLSELVNDLLDLAKVEAGKIVVRPHEFEVKGLFAALRGMLKPLLAGNSSVTLAFDEAPDLPVMNTDESKVSQILRNFISNALKFTEQGEVRVSARSENNCILFSVSDTGIGIDREDQERIFEEWAQVDHPMQRKVKGTGLGLPLSRRLAQLLGGNVWCVSEGLGKGATFHATIPVVYSGAGEARLTLPSISKLDPSLKPVLVVEDNRESLFIYERYLRGSGFQVLPAATLKEARRFLQTNRPAAILLDILLESESSWPLLVDLKSDSATKDIPVIVVTMVDNERKARSLGADAFAVKPIDRDWLLQQLSTLTAKPDSGKLLIIDDDEISRYLLRGVLSDSGCTVIDATGGEEGLRLARTERPDAIFLDLRMPDIAGMDVLRLLKEDKATADIPVIINTSKVLNEAEREWLLHHAAGILSKDAPSQELARARVRDALATAGVLRRSVSDVPLT